MKFSNKIYHHVILANKSSHFNYIKYKNDIFVVFLNEAYKSISYE